MKNENIKFYKGSNAKGKINSAIGCKSFKKVQRNLGTTDKYFIK